MDQLHYTTNHHKKGKHLTFEERVLIQTRCRDGWSANRIAKEIGCASNTVRNELKRGAVSLYHGKVTRYKASKGQEVYEKNRSACGRRCAMDDKHDFIAYVEKHVTEDHWSLDACVGRALKERIFHRAQTVCTKTLYNYVKAGLLHIKAIDLPQLVKRRKNTGIIRKNKRRLGRSIEERDPSIQTRQEFGHWECDLVLGSKSDSDQVLLTLAERKTREFLIIRAERKSADAVMTAFQILQDMFGEHFGKVFKTITTDNGSEFARLSELETFAETLVYYTHPYTSCEKGTNENLNGLIRRFIPKGKRIESFSDQQLLDILFWANGLPRRIHDYQTPDELFEIELDRIYSCAA